MDKRLAEAVQAQINNELYSSYLYLSMSSWAEELGWKGFAHWFRVQAQEEQVHGLTLHDQLIERGERSILKQIDTPPSEWDSPLAAIDNTLTHEKFITEKINELATIAMDVKDHAFYQFIQMFLKEQVEEEATATDILVRLRRLNGHVAMIEALDKELGARIFAPPFVTAGV